MKTPILIAAAALALPLPAAAQSLHETHELVWQPNGKHPAASYRLRGPARCSAAANHHQAGKSAMPARKGYAMPAGEAKRDRQS